MTSPGPAVLVEACCDSVQTARAAQDAGAGRIELCGPGDGGTTPSLGLLARCRDLVTLPLHIMIRPHTHSFVYDTADLDVMANDIVAARVLGADGVVLGPLRPDGQIDTEALQVLVACARPMRVAFHRAFDRTSTSAESSLQPLLDAGVDLVLTSGHAPTALEGADTLRALHTQAADRLVVLAGGSVRADTVHPLLARTGVREVHVRGTDPRVVHDVVHAVRNAG
jgi:copper homeostasis protein